MEEANHKKLILIIVGAVVLLAVVVGIILLTGSEKEATPAKDDSQSTPSDDSGVVAPKPPRSRSDSENTLAQQAAEEFGDISQDDVAAPAVGWLLDNKMTQECEQGKFCPDAPMSRSSVAIMLWWAAGSPTPKASGAEIFNDVTADSPANMAIGWLSEEKLTNGCAENQFCPDKTVSRGQLATFLYRHTGAQVTGSSVFADVADDSYYALPILWLAQNNITQGCEEGKFCPDEDATVAQAAIFMHRIEFTQSAWGSRGGILQGN